MIVLKTFDMNVFGGVKVSFFTIGATFIITESLV